MAVRAGEAHSRGPLPLSAGIHLCHDVLEGRQQALTESGFLDALEPAFRPEMTHPNGLRFRIARILAVSSDFR